MNDYIIVVETSYQYHGNKKNICVDFREYISIDRNIVLHMYPQGNPKLIEKKKKKRFDSSVVKDNLVTSRHKISIILETIISL